MVVVFRRVGKAVVLVVPTAALLLMTGPAAWADSATSGSHSAAGNGQPGPSHGHPAVTASLARVAPGHAGPAHAGKPHPRNATGRAAAARRAGHGAAKPAIGAPVVHRTLRPVSAIKATTPAHPTHKVKQVVHEAKHAASKAKPGAQRARKGIHPRTALGQHGPGSTRAGQSPGQARRVGPVAPRQRASTRAARHAAAAASLSHPVATSAVAGPALANTTRDLPSGQPPASVPHRTTHRSAVPKSQPRRTPPPPLAQSATPLLTPLRTVKNALTSLSRWSLFNGPLVSVFCGVLLLALTMIVTGVTTGRGSPRHWWRSRSLRGDLAT